MTVDSDTARRNLRRLIRASGLTQAAVANKAGYCHGSLRRHIYGLTPMTEHQVGIYATALGVDPAEFHRPPNEAQP